MSYIPKSLSTLDKSSSELKGIIIFPFPLESRLNSALLLNLVFNSFAIFLYSPESSINFFALGAEVEITSSGSFSFKLLTISSTCLTERSCSEMASKSASCVSLSSTLKIDSVSVILLSVFTDYSYPGGKIPINEIIDLIRFDNCKSHLLRKSINELVDKNFLKINKSPDNGEITYSLTEEFEKFLGKNL